MLELCNRLVCSFYSYSDSAFVRHNSSKIVIDLMIYSYSITSNTLPCVDQWFLTQIVAAAPNQLMCVCKCFILFYNFLCIGTNISCMCGRAMPLGFRKGIMHECIECPKFPLDTCSQQPQLMDHHSRCVQLFTIICAILYIHCSKIVVNVLL